MSAHQVTMSKLHCDAKGCPTIYENVGRPVSHLRELAANDGWRHRKVTFATSNWARSVDLCPVCPDDAELKPLERSSR